ncbi:MAG: hypothetical protein CL912_09645 [Deltaproteobacteria bacterium]|nr:hypothetical protein [Deltaproteobacteria bacterium]
MSHLGGQIQVVLTSGELNSAYVESPGQIGGDLGLCGTHIHQDSGPKVPVTRFGRCPTFVHNTTHFWKTSTAQPEASICSLLFILGIRYGVAQRGTHKYPSNGLLVPVWDLVELYGNSDKGHHSQCRLVESVTRSLGDLVPQHPLIGTGRQMRYLEEQYAELPLRR